MYKNNLRAPAVPNPEKYFREFPCMKQISLNVSPLTAAYVFCVSLKTKELVEFNCM